MLFHGQYQSSDCYEKLHLIGKGTYGKVFKAKNKTTGEIVALKQVDLRSKNAAFPATSLREASVLFNIDHPNVVKLHEVIFNEKSLDASNSKSNQISDVYLVFEYCEYDLATLMDTMISCLPKAEIKCILQYLLRALDALHLHNIIHRDIKLPNIFLTSNGELRVGDFGLARFFEPFEVLTADVVTIWYRAPELLLGESKYTEAIDIWAVGCVFGELLLGSPLLPGRSEIHQMELICNLVGIPNSKIWSNVEKLPKFNTFKFPANIYNNIPMRFFQETPNSIDLLNRLLICDPAKRITARDALRHPYFVELPLPQSVSLYKQRER